MAGLRAAPHIASQFLRLKLPAHVAESTHCTASPRPIPRLSSHFGNGTRCPAPCTNGAQGARLGPDGGAARHRVRCRSVEVDFSFGLPGLVMVGLPDAAVRESRDRVRSAIRNSGFAFPQHRVTVNLAPADVRKAGAAFDLPIALGVLAATGIVTTRAITDALLVGELSLDGSMQPTRGVLPIAASARRDGCHRLLLPRRTPRRRRLSRACVCCRSTPCRKPSTSLNHAVEPRAVVRPHRETA